MKKILIILVISTLVLFFGYGLFFMGNEQEKIHHNKKVFEKLQREDVESITMICYSLYKYSLSEEEMDQFFELSKDVVLDSNVSQSAVVGDGCRVYGEIVIRMKDGTALQMKALSVDGTNGLMIDGYLYAGVNNSVDLLEKFLTEIENREFLLANQQVGVKAEFPLKDLKEAEVESILLKCKEKEYHLSEAEIDDFCEKFWNLAFYEEVETYKEVQDIYDVFETEVLIQKHDSNIITLRLNYKVIIINDKSHIIRMVAQSKLYNFIRNCMNDFSE